MSCECYGRVLDKLRDHAESKLPNGAVDLSVSLGGYMFGVTEDGMTHRSSNPVEIRYQAPKKAGGMKNVVDKTFVRATYCPFCGVKY